jgi:TRAP-type mannitol/chloroaromatic compound transport system substrate-binding protein
MNAQFLGAGEIITALQGGTIDGAELSQPLRDHEFGVQRVASNYYYPSWHAPVTLYELQVNLDHWNGLSEAQRGLITEACRQITESSKSSAEAALTEGLARIKAVGVQVHPVPRQILDVIRHAQDEVAREFSANDPEFKRVWESYSLFR